MPTFDMECEKCGFQKEYFFYYMDKTKHEEVKCDECGEIMTELFGTGIPPLIRNASDKRMKK